jgi:chromosome segregation ATPase
VNQADFDAFRSEIQHKLIDIEKSVMSAAETLIDKRLDDERQQRQSDIDRLHRTLDDFGRKLDPVVSGVSEIKGKLDGFTKAIEDRDRRLDGQDKRLDEQGYALNRLASENLEVKGDLRTLNNTLHSNPENRDDTPSIVGMVGEIQRTMQLRFDHIDASHAALESDIALLKAERQQRHNRVQRLKTVVVEFARSPYGASLLTLFVLWLASIAFPIIQNELAQLALKQLSNSGG